MEQHTTDTQPSRLFVANNADLWATIDIIRNSQDGKVMPIATEDWADSLGYDDKRLVRIASLVRSRRVFDSNASVKDQGKQRGINP
jgi:hypothetical protein